MKLSFIVSAWARPDALRTCLSSIIQQTFTDFEVIVMDNSPDQTIRNRHRELCWMDPRVMYADSHHIEQVNLSCYFSGEAAANRMAQGEWLCFPSDDSYYVPTFAEKLIAAGETGEGCDIPTGPGDGPLAMVCCDFVWGRHNHWSYCDGGPQMAHIDKTTFIIRAEWFRKIGWPQKHPQGGNSNSDGLLAEELVARGGRVGRVCEILVVHN
jgi:GT2 family glycosyltransferase